MQVIAPKWKDTEQSIHSNLIFFILRDKQLKKKKKPHTPQKTPQNKNPTKST
jgi:hypothetical protein